MSTFTVKFHFPNACITIERVPEEQMSAWKYRVANGLTLHVRGRNYNGEENDTEYLILPPMVTFMEVTPYLPF